MAYNWQQQVEPKGGFYPETKVYFDGSHYIAIPHTERPFKPRKKHIEEIVSEQNKWPQLEELSAEEAADSPFTENEISAPEEKPDALIGVENNNSPYNMCQITQKLGKKELFEKFYREHINEKRSERRKKIIEAMLPFFEDRTATENYVDANMARKKRNLICRRVRMVRKANLADFNFFVTLTYDDKKHTECSFKKQLKTCFRNLCYRRNWKYMGVWERSPERKRLHFHGLFNIPDNAVVGEFQEVTDYSTNLHAMQTINQNTYFAERFGRNDFKELDKRLLGEALGYLMKYLEKTGEKIVYSKGLPQFFISDIMEDDIVCTIGQEDKKLLLFDDFKCWDEGVNVGTVSKVTIAQLRKSN